MKIHLIFFLTFFLTLTEMSSSIAADIVFIMNENSPVSKLTVTELKDYYFKRRRQWPDGVSVRFIDRGSGSEIRKMFLSSILNTSSEDLDLFWIGQKLYSGDNAPLQQPSESLTLQLVSTLKGAISYVSDSTILPPKGIKVIRVEHGEL